MARYRIIDRGVLDQTTGERIPPDISHPGWQAYQEWFSQGNVPDPPLPPEPDPVDERRRYVEAGLYREQRLQRKMTDDEFIAAMRLGKVKR